MSRAPTRCGSASFDAWTRARPANDFATMLPFLEKALDLSREYADFFAPYEHVADPLIDDADEGMTTASIRALFAGLRSELVPMVRAISEQPPADDSCLHGVFAEAAQLDFSRTMAERMGYDLQRGRLDTTHHPFCTKFSVGDVRITTRVYESDIGQALFSTLHEAGHALYEQGVSAALEGTPLGYGTSAGVHESQSRLWENVVARSRGFWQHFYPLLQQSISGPVRAGGARHLLSRHQQGRTLLIRTDADEVTYNLHIMLRFDLELEMLEGRLRVEDLPEAWREAHAGRSRPAPARRPRWLPAGRPLVFRRHRRRISELHHRQYSQRAVLCRRRRGASRYPAARSSRAAFGTLHGWLRERIYRHGRKYQPNELVERATGGP